MCGNLEVLVSNKRFGIIDINFPNKSMINKRIGCMNTILFIIDDDNNYILNIAYNLCSCSSN